MKYKIIITVLCLLMLTGCSKAPVKAGLSYEMPAGWTVSSEGKIGQDIKFTVLTKGEDNQIKIYYGDLPNGYAEYLYDDHLKGNKLEDRSVLGVKQALTGDELYRIVTKERMILEESIHDKQSKFQKVERSAYYK